RLEPREADLGEFSVRRVLPSTRRRSVGPFVFFDHMGPASFPPGKGIAVRPHPHIGLATITYLFEGEIMHRDSLGVVQPIRPGAVNLMTAGRGIVHSERAGEDLDQDSRLHGIQSWIALPEALEECEPAFDHFPAADIPDVTLPGVSVAVIMGDAYGVSSPVRTYSPTLYLDCRFSAGAALTLPQGWQELALYVVDGEVEMADETVSAGVMLIVDAASPPALQACCDSRLMVIGGDDLGPRKLFWNFVHSSAERIEQAKADWSAGRFDAVPGDDEYIPLPN
ncbi:MAG: pirin family protein, partial [Halieaceae bacterium]|nr:pirin family protein [Halieaceae bacterium]